MKKIASALLAPACFATLLLSPNPMSAAVDAPVIPENVVSIPANHPHIQFVGRVDDSDPKRPRFSFPGVTIRARFQSDSLALLWEDEAIGGEANTNAYTVAINGTDIGVLVPQKDVTRYPIASDLGDGTHTIEIRKRTEGGVGAARFIGFELSADGKMMEPPPRASRRIEFIGDSITCGYGNMVAGDPPKETFSSLNQNHDIAYGALTAKRLGAESHTVAYSGRGVYASYSGETENQMPTIYQRTVADDDSPAWDHSRWSPHVVVINLGTNDFAQKWIRDEDYRLAYSQLLIRVRANHPDALIVCCLGPMIQDGWPSGSLALTRSRAILTGMINRRAAGGDTRIVLHEFTRQRSPYGESSHPSAIIHSEMAESLSARIGELMKWEPATP